MYYGRIKPFTIENGPGVRVSLFVSGCTHRCKGCFSQETWDFSYGEPFTEKTQERLLELLSPPYIAGLTLLGGDPGEPENQEALLPLLMRVRGELPQKDVWLYSGYRYEDFLPGGRAACGVTDSFLALCDVLVDGPFVESQKDLTLAFRGSGNQRIIDLKRMRESGKDGGPFLWQP